MMGMMGSLSTKILCVLPTIKKLSGKSCRMGKVKLENKYNINTCIYQIDNQLLC